METISPGIEGHPSTWVNFSKRLYEKKRASLPEPTALVQALIVSHWPSWPVYLLFYFFALLREAVFLELDSTKLEDKL